MKDIVLGEQQKEALSLIYDFINSDETIFVLSGYAGTGKSMLTKIIVDKLEEDNVEYILAAPTHRAKTVLSSFTGRKSLTLHKLLSLSPDLEIMNLDMRDLRFVMNSKTNSFPSNAVIICDEASMVNDHLFDVLLSKSESVNSKIIFIGDIAQIKPVNSREDTSKVFEVDNKYVLTDIYRQGKENPIGDILFKSRSEIINRFEDIESEEGFLKCYTDPSEFIDEMIPIYQKAIDDKNILEIKVLSYTNKRVGIFNREIQKRLFGTDKEYYKGQIITAYDNFEFKNDEFFNSMDYIVYEDPTPIHINIHNIGSFPGYELKLYDQGTDTVKTANVLSKELSGEEYYYISKCIEQYRINAINFKHSNKKVSNINWSNYFKAMGSFITPIDMYYEGRLIRSKSIDYGYAVTFHKIQGGSINNVFIDMKSIALCRDLKERRQLQYVGLSRTNKNIYILQQ